MPFDTQASLDVVDTDARGKSGTSKLEGRAFGVGLKHAFVDVLRHPDTSFAVSLDYRMAQAKASTPNSAITPVPAHSYGAHADGTSWLVRDRFALHLHGTVARLVLSTEDASIAGWTAGAVLGGDLVLGQGFSLRGDVGYYHTYGDLQTNAFPITGGIHFGPVAGFFADLAGTLWPRGVELVDGALSDLTIFRLDPIIRRQSALQDLKSHVIGLATIQLGYRASF